MISLDDLKHRLGDVDTTDGMELCRLLDLAVDHISKQDQQIARLERQVCDLQLVVMEMRRP